MIGESRRGFGIDRIMIADEITKIRQLNQVDNRDVLIEMISDAIGYPLNPRESTVPRFHLYNIIDACVDQPGGLDALARALDFIHPRSRAAALIREWMMPQTGQHISPGSGRRIQSLLGNLPVPDTSALFLAVAGSAWDVTGPVPSGPVEAFRLLLDTNTSPGELPPHLRFVEAVADSMMRSAHHTWASELRAWVDSELSLLDGPDRAGLPAKLAELRAKPAAVQPVDRAVYLVIALEPAEQPGGLYRLAHWTDTGCGEWSPVRGEDQTTTLDDAPWRVAKLIRSVEANALYEHEGSLHLEFVLPLHLMNLAVDRWLADPPDEPVPRTMGTRFHTVVRNLERLRRGDLHREWRERWRQLGENSAIAVEYRTERTHWVPSNQPVDLVQLERTVSDKGVACCGFGRPPEGANGQDALWVVLRGGIPVIVWHRVTDRFEEFQEAVMRIIEEGGISQLMAGIQALRIQAAGADAQMGSDITLVWDDFDRALGIGVPMAPPLEIGPSGGER